MMKRLVCRGFLSSPAAIRSDGEFGQVTFKATDVFGFLVSALPRSIVTYRSSQRSQWNLYGRLEYHNSYNRCRGTSNRARLHGQRHDRWLRRNCEGGGDHHSPGFSLINTN